MMEAASRDGDLVVLNAPEYLDAESGQLFLDRCLQQLDTATGRILLHLGRTAMVNSAGAMYLLEVAAGARSRGCGVALCCGTRVIIRSLEIMGMGSYATLHATEEAALGALREA